MCTTVTEVTSRSFSVLAATKATQVKHAVDCGSGSDLLTYAIPVCRGVVTSEIKRFDQDVLTPLFRLDIQGLPLSAHLAFGETIPLFDVEDFGLGPNWLGILREKLYVRQLYPESWPGEVLLEGRSPKILILDENGLGPIDSRRGGITRAVVGLGKPVELFRRLKEPCKPSRGDRRAVAGGRRVEAGRTGGGCGPPASPSSAAVAVTPPVLPRPARGCRPLQRRLRQLHRPPPGVPMPTAPSGATAPIRPAPSTAAQAKPAGPGGKHHPVYLPAHRVIC